MPTTNITVTGLTDADRHLRTFFQKLTDLSPFWRELGQTLANEAQ